MCWLWITRRKSRPRISQLRIGANGRNVKIHIGSHSAGRPVADVPIENDSSPHVIPNRVGPTEECPPGPANPLRSETAILIAHSLLNVFASRSVLLTMIRPILLFLALSAFAQTAASPAFEVASIKAHTSGGYMHMFQFQPGGRLHASNTWIVYAIEQAYDLKYYQVIGAPSWSTSDRYDIEAKAAASDATREQVCAMLQTLLADRCQLKFHRETKEFPVYNLVVGKSGSRLRPLKPGERSQCTRDNSEACGTQTLEQLTQWLTSITGHPVFDRTGIEGTYDILLNFDVYEARSQPAPPGYDKPTLSTALADQLGLRLEATKAQLPVLVIESIQRPSDN
jgi:uncharacterized protein (TIGR03435 family)